MEQTDETTTDKPAGEKPQAGAWESAQGYPLKIKFEIDKPVSVLFAADFENPLEMPNQDGLGVFYIFDVTDGNGDKASFATSAWTLIKSLKTHEPLAGKQLIITKKNVKGKNFFYVTRPEAYNAPAPEDSTTAEEVAVEEDATI